MLRTNRFFIVTFMFVLLVSWSGLQVIAKESATDERERAQSAATVLTEIMDIPEGGIPNSLLDGAEAVAVFPHVIKGAFVVGGEYGKGMVSHRMSNGKWSAPAYIKIAGGSFGLQIGGQATDLVLVFTNKDGFDGLLKGKVKLGADAAVAAGPVGRNASASTDVLLKSPVLAYSRSKGLFAGISLDGAVVSMDDSANKKAYGRELTGEDIMVNNKAHANDVVMPYVRALEKYSPTAKKRITD